jgi:hypothetical protein
VASDGSTRVINVPDGTDSTIYVLGKDPNASLVVLRSGEGTSVQPGQPPTSPANMAGLTGMFGERVVQGPGLRFEERTQRRREEQVQAEAQAEESRLALVAAQAELNRLAQQENALRQELTALVGAQASGGKGSGPGNDSFVGATPVASLPARVATNTLSAGTEPGEPTRPCGQIGRTVWYSLSLPAVTTVAVDTFGSNFDTVLAVYSASPPSPSALVACNDDTASAQSRVTFTAAAGVTYFVQVGGAAGAGGNLVVNVDAAARPPANDPFAGAIAVSGIGAQFTANTASATTEPGEPTQPSCGGGSRPRIGNTVWYAFSSPTATAVAVDTFGSSFDTVVAVYTGTSLGSLALVRCNDDSLGTLQSRVSISARAGTLYFMQVGGFASSFGNLIVRFGPAPPPPANDDFAAAAPIPALPPLSSPPTPLSFSALTESASVEPGEPTTFNCGGVPTFVDTTVWYSLTPTSSGFVQADTFQSDFDTVLAVWTGTSLGGLTQVACNDETDVTGTTITGRSRVAFPVTAGTAYRIQVGGARGSDPLAPGAFGNLVLSVAAAPPPPPNDPFAGAITVTIPPLAAPPVQVTADTTSATVEPGEPVATCSGSTVSMGNTVWYAFTPSTSTTVTIDTFGSSFDTVLAVYTGSSLPNLSQVACNNDTLQPGTANLRQSRVSLSAAAGTTYRVQIGGFFGQFGSVVANFRSCNPPPANDPFAGATPITALPISFNVDTTCATVEAGEPTSVFLCGGIPIGNTVWYSFRPTTNTPITVDTAGSNFDTIISVHTGTGLGALTNVACNDDPSTGGAQARVSFLAGANTTYYVQIGGYNSAFGNLQVTFGPPATPPNDNFANATTVGMGRFTAVTFAATTEPGEPTAVDAGCGPTLGTIGKTVWYRFTATANGTMTMNTVGSDFDTVLAVYTGPAVNSLVRVACDDDSAGEQSQLTMPVVAGTTYHVQVGGFNGAAGNVVINFGPIPGPGGPVVRATPPADPKAAPPRSPAKSRDSIPPKTAPAAPRSR